jgi:hypothetical protein
MTSTTRPLTAEAVVRLLVDTDPYLSCDDCFARLDEYVERRTLQPGYDDPAMRNTSKGCGACSEEAETLLTLILDPPT